MLSAFDHLLIARLLNTPWDEFGIDDADIGGQLELTYCQFRVKTTISYQMEIDNEFTMK